MVTLETEAESRSRSPNQIEQHTTPTLAVSTDLRSPPAFDDCTSLLTNCKPTAALSHCTARSTFGQNADGAAPQVDAQSISRTGRGAALHFNLGEQHRTAVNRSPKRTAQRSKTYLADEGPLSLFIVNEGIEGGHVRGCLAVCRICG